jgi:hypothetical protein
MLDQFLLDRLAYEPNPEPMEPIPWPEGQASTPVSAESSAQGAEASPELILTTGTEGGIAAATSLSDVFIVSNANSNCTQRFAAIPFAQQRFVESPSAVFPCRHVSQRLNHRFTPEGPGDSNDTNRYSNSY